MSDHVCQCRVCEPDRFPPDFHAPDRQSDGHLSVRFGDAGPHWDVYLDGERVETPIEVVDGEHRWLIVPADRPFHLCACGSREPCQYVRRVSVRIERT